MKYELAHLIQKKIPTGNESANGVQNSGHDWGPTGRSRAREPATWQCVDDSLTHNSSNGDQIHPLVFQMPTYLSPKTGKLAKFKHKESSPK